MSHAKVRSRPLAPSKPPDLLHVNEGEMLGIVGRSGAGKTTLVNLISRLYDVNEGEIRIDGIPVKELGFRDLRRNVA